MEQNSILRFVYNHLDCLQNDEGKIRFLELYFNIKLKWYQKLYLKMDLLIHNNTYKLLKKFFQFMKVRRR